MTGALGQYGTRKGRCHKQRRRKCVDSEHVASSH
jgi:hypothetical protein